MRTSRWMVAAVAGAAVLSVGSVVRAQSGTAGSAHDFTLRDWNLTGTLCGACHTPHKAGDPDQLIPLWNHMTDKSGGFTPYTSESLDATDVGQPSGPSLACLSCHDGVVAVDSYGKDLLTGDQIVGSHLISDTGEFAAMANFGKDLSDDHPISFNYDAGLVSLDGYLRAPSDLITGVPSLATKTIEQALLKNGRMECTSCHDPHRQKGTNVEYPSSLFLLIDGPKGSGYDGSLLCLQCHIK